MPEAAIFDYGVGNLLSLRTALEKVGLKTKITVSSKQLSSADAIALPGVGNFSAAATKLARVKQTLLDAATFLSRKRGRPRRGAGDFRGQKRSIERRWD